METNMITRPMLAATVDDIDKLTYPLLATPKIDGIRCLIINGKVLSRTFKPIPNKYIREKLSVLPDLDGELIVGNNFQDCSSGIMSIKGKPEFKYLVFDIPTLPETTPYWKRAAAIEGRNFIYTYVVALVPKPIENKEMLLNYEEEALAKGYEGVMLRHPDGPYKCGRSTFKEGYLLKLKRFQDSEAEILDFEEQMHNANPQTEDNFGLAERSSHVENMIGKDTLGKLIVRDIYTKVEFSVGTGFDNHLRQKIWDNKQSYIGKHIVYKFQPHGVKDKPRCPVFKSFRTDHL